jgi:ankyrin repeat protein
VDANKIGGRNALIYWAARLGHVEVMKLLLSHVEIKITTFYGGTTLLQIAASKGKIAVVELLLSQFSIDVNARMSHSPFRTPLYMAARHGHLHVVQQLVAHKAIDLNSLSGPYHAYLRLTGQTPLHAAAARGHLNVVQFLLDKPTIDSGHRDANKKTALQYAAFHGHWQTVNLKLEYSSQSGDHLYTRDLSLSNDAFVTFDVIRSVLGHTDFQDVNLTIGDKGLSLLHHACKRGDCDAIRVLLAHQGINVNLKNYDGETPLMFAVRHDHLEAVELLLQHSDIEINHENQWGETALTFAKPRQYQEIVDLLLSHGTIDNDANPSTTIEEATNTLYAPRPNNAPSTVPEFQFEPLYGDLTDDGMTEDWGDLMDDGLTEDWEKDLDMEEGM